MENVTEYVTALIICEIAGALNEKEQQLLHQLRKKFEPVRALSDFFNEYPIEVQRKGSEALRQEARQMIKKAELRLKQSSKYRMWVIFQHLRFWKK